MRMLILISAVAIVTVAAAASTHKTTTTNANLSANSIDEISKNVDMNSLPATVSALY
jgi:hypothetical protein